jgi:nucleoside-diphosphate-sugar epimerase
MHGKPRLLIAGAGGTIGLRLTRRLSSTGVEVVGLTRSAEKRALIEAAGARGLVADALDPAAVRAAVDQTRPDQIVNLLTALPAAGALRPAHLRATNRLRRDGSLNLLRAALDAGVPRVVAESFVAVWGDVAATCPLTEDGSPGAIQPGDPLHDTIQALRDLERLHFEAAEGAVETVVLRYGFLYGPGVPSTELLVRNLRRRMAPVPANASGIASWIHIDDAVSATLAVLESPRPAPLYHVCDDEPVSIAAAAEAAGQAFGARPPVRLPDFVLRLAAPVVASMTSKYLGMSNARIRRELGWHARFGSVREGFADLARERRRAS